MRQDIIPPNFYDLICSRIKAFVLRAVLTSLFLACLCAMSQAQHATNSGSYSDRNNPLGTQGQLTPTPLYTPANAVQDMTLGAGLHVDKTYDDRLRPAGEIATHP